MNTLEDDWDGSYTDGALISWEEGIDNILPWPQRPAPSCYGEQAERGRQACDDCPLELSCWIEAYYVPWLAEDGEE